LPYGTRVTRERLDQIGALEAELHGLGIRQARVRWHPLHVASSAGAGALPPASLSAPSSPARTERAEAAMARIEVGQDELPLAFERRDAIAAAGKRLGFTYVTLDLLGYRTGSHNEVLRGRTLRVLS
jgi:uncharacterized protein